MNPNETRLSLLMVKPDAFAHAGAILDALSEHGFQIGRILSLKLDRTAVEIFYQEHVGRPYFEVHAAFMTSGRVLGVEVLGEEAVVARLRTVVGSTDPKQAGGETLRGRFGTSLPRNAVHASDSHDAAIRETSLFFAKFPLFCPM